MLSPAFEAAEREKDNGNTHIGTIIGFQDAGGAVSLVTTVRLQHQFQATECTPDINIGLLRYLISGIQSSHAQRRESGLSLIHI